MYVGDGIFDKLSSQEVVACAWNSIQKNDAIDEHE